MKFIYLLSLLISVSVLATTKLPRKTVSSKPLKPLPPSSLRDDVNLIIKDSSQQAQEKKVQIEFVLQRWVKSNETALYGDASLRVIIDLLSFAESANIDIFPSSLRMINDILKRDSSPVKADTLMRCFTPLKSFFPNKEILDLSKVLVHKLASIDASRGFSARNVALMFFGLQKLNYNDSAFKDFIRVVNEKGDEKCMV